MNFFAKTLIAATALTASATASFSEEAKTLNFGIISTESSSQLKPIWQPFLAAMEEKTGMKVKAFFATDYAGIIEGMKFGKVDLAWYGNKSAMEAVDRANGEVFVQTVDVTGNPGYWSLLITHKDSPLNSLEDVLKCDKSLNFGLGDPNSTSGYLVPTTFIYTQRDIDIKDCYKRVTNASHGNNLEAVANKQLDFATNNTESLDRFKHNNPEGYKNIKEIWRSPLIPADPIVWNKDLDDGLKTKIKGFFMNYGRNTDAAENEKELKILADLQWAPFRESSDAQLYPIRVLAISKKLNKLNKDTSMSADDKAAKIAELEAEKAKYEKLMAAKTQG